MRKPHHGRNGTRHVGRLRIAAAEILSQSLGFTVYPEDVFPATGAWRTNWRLDVYRWELFAQNAAGMPIVAGCWDSLTKFVRESKQLGGCHISRDGVIYAGPATAE